MSAIYRTRCTVEPNVCFLRVEEDEGSLDLVVSENGTFRLICLDAPKARELAAHLNRLAAHLESTLDGGTP